MPAPPTSPRTGRVQGGPGAGPGLAEGAEDTSEEFRPPAGSYAAPRSPPTPQPACPPGKALLPSWAFRPRHPRR